MHSLCDSSPLLKTVENTVKMYHLPTYLQKHTSIKINILLLQQHTNKIHTVHHTNTNKAPLAQITTTRIVISRLMLLQFLSVKLLTKFILM